MREKFTITPEDRKFESSFKKSVDSLHSPRIVKKAQSRTIALSKKIAGGTIGKSHYSGKKYRHD